VKVALSGDGGDELFGGYGRYFRALQVLSVPPFLRPLWRPFRKRWMASRDPATWKHDDGGAVDTLYRRYLDRSTHGAVRRLFGDRLRRRASSPPDDPVERSLRRLEALPPLARLLAVDLETRIPDYHLARVDRASMRASLEVRVPLLDVAFVERVIRLPAAVRLMGGRSKGLLRAAMEGLLPGEILRRGKRGFHPPMNRWLGGRLAAQARETLASSLAVEEGLLDPDGIASLVRPDRSGKVNGRLIWRVMVLESWLRRIRGRRLARRDADGTSRSPPTG
jgi:asparagine synthase (glutamine-hydrolysing)